jgi:hypothetical protein
VQGRITERETTMNTRQWRAYAAHLRGLASALLHEDDRESGSHPPDLCRRTLLYDRYLR